MNLLVTGASGFTGSFMIRLLEQKNDINITALAWHRAPSDSGLKNISWITANLIDRDVIKKIISDIPPDRIVHIAGLNHGRLDELLQVNVMGTKNLLDAAYQVNPSCRILVIGSSAVYGCSGNHAITEDSPFRPLSDYGLSKAAQDSLAIMTPAISQMHIAVARPFNLIGPGQSDSFVCGKIIRQAVQMEMGLRENLELLEVKSSRDFLDVRDAVNGYWALLSHKYFDRDCSGMAFNVGSGSSRTIAEVIECTEKVTGRQYPVKLPECPVKVRLSSQRSDNNRIHTLTGWSPEISLAESLGDMLEAERHSLIE